MAASPSTNTETEVLRLLKTRRWSSRNQVLLAAGFAALLLLLPTPLLIHILRYTSTDDAQVSAHIVQISSQVPGTVKRVLVDDDVQVKAGEQLVVIDPVDLELSLQEKEADATNALARWRQSKASLQLATKAYVSKVRNVHSSVQISGQRINSSSAQLDVSRAKLQEDLAAQAFSNNQLTQITALFQSGIVSRQSLLSTRNDSARLAAEIRGDKAAVDVGIANLLQEKELARNTAADLTEAVTTREDITKASSDAEALEAAYRLAEDSLAQAVILRRRTIVRAPFDGIVAARTVQPGQNLAAGDALLSIVDLKHLWITANFKETQLRGLYIGKPVEVFIDAYHATLTGHVEGISGGSGTVFSLIPPDNATGNFVKVIQRLPVRIAIPNDHKLILRPGMSATVRFPR